jgi:hypothetical protein
MGEENKVIRGEQKKPKNRENQKKITEKTKQ